MLSLLTNIKKLVSRRNIFLSVSILYFTLSGFISCNYKNEDKKQFENKSKKKNILPYDLKNPETTYKLPGYLDEISGISSYENNKIACVQDEHATIYMFDTEKAKITLKSDFGKTGDFEDIAVVGNDAYVLRSDGTIFKIKSFEKKTKATKIKTTLSSKNNTEGLFYDKSNNSLLIALKGSASINEKNQYKGFKAIYRFDLKNNTLIEKPIYLIDLSKTDNIKKLSRIEKFYIETAKKLKLLKQDNSFQPSGIAIQPFENNVYIISAVEKLLIIMNKKGVIQEVFELDKRIFNHPEGICFSETGDLFISNEGKNGKGNILRFKYNRIKQSVNETKNK